MLSASQGHIPPWHLCSLNCSSCRWHKPSPMHNHHSFSCEVPCNTRAHQISRREMPYGQVETSARRRQWSPRTTCLHPVFTQFSSGEKTANPPVPALSPRARRGAIACAHAPGQLSTGGTAPVYNSSAASPHTQLGFTLTGEGCAAAEVALAGCWAAKAVPVSQADVEPPPRPLLGLARVTTSC